MYIFCTISLMMKAEREDCETSDILASFVTMRPIYERTSVRRAIKYNTVTSISDYKTGLGLVIGFINHLQVVAAGA
jgi:hypothetical protein